MNKKLTIAFLLSSSPLFALGLADPVGILGGLVEGFARFFINFMICYLILIAIILGINYILRNRPKAMLITNVILSAVWIILVGGFLIVNDAADMIFSIIFEIPLIITIAGIALALRNRKEIVSMNADSLRWRTMGSGDAALIDASCDGDLAMVKYLVENGADTNARDGDGWSALMWASRLGYLEIVKLLLANGANVNAKNQCGETALHWAKAEKREAIKEVLEKVASDKQDLSFL